MKHLLVSMGTLLLMTPALAENPRCVAEFQRESDRIQREALARAPAPGSDVRTQQEYMRPIHEALKAAEERARACEAASRPRPGSPAAQAASAREQQCTDAANRELDQVRQRLPAQGTPTPEQQRAYREAEARVLDARMECLRRAR